MCHCGESLGLTAHLGFCRHPRFPDVLPCHPFLPGYLLLSASSPGQGPPKHTARPHISWMAGCWEQRGNCRRGGLPSAGVPKQLGDVELSGPCPGLRCPGRPFSFLTGSPMLAPHWGRACCSPVVQVLSGFPSVVRLLRRLQLFDL